jgi:hypothetical protein
VGEREHRQPVPARPELRPVARRSMAHAGGRQGRERDPPGRPEPERASAAARAPPFAGPLRARGAANGSAAGTRRVIQRRGGAGRPPGAPSRPARASARDTHRRRAGGAARGADYPRGRMASTNRCADAAHVKPRTRRDPTRRRARRRGGGLRGRGPVHAPPRPADAVSPARVGCAKQAAVQVLSPVSVDRAPAPLGKRNTGVGPPAHRALRP